MKYLICEIAGKQVKVIPNKPFEVEMETELKEINSNVLLISDDKLQIGTPFLKDAISLKVLDNTLGEKVRVAKFHAKANYRRVTGYRKHVTKMVFEAKS